MKPLKLTCLGHELTLCSDDGVPEGADPRDHVFNRDLLSWFMTPGSNASEFGVEVSFEYYEGGEHEGMWTVRATLYSVGGGIYVEGYGHTLEVAESAIAPVLKRKITAYSSLLAFVEAAPHLEIDTNP